MYTKLVFENLGNCHYHIISFFNSLTYGFSTLLHCHFHQALKFTLLYILSVFGFEHLVALFFS